jgi:hypothetical protein
MEMKQQAPNKSVQATAGDRCGFNRPPQASRA